MLFRSGRAMATHLIDAGHRHLAYLDSGVDTDFRAHERGAGFADEVKRSGGRFQLLRASTGDPFDAGRKALASLRAAQNRTPPSALACANDHLASGVLMEAVARGLAVPQDLAVLGFGDFPVGRQLQPALSTVRPPSQEIGRAAAQALVSSLATGATPTSLALPWQLIGRASTTASG